MATHTLGLVAAVASKLVRAQSPVGGRHEGVLQGTALAALPYHVQASMLAEETPARPSNPGT